MLVLTLGDLHPVGKIERPKLVVPSLEVMGREYVGTYAYDRDGDPRYNQTNEGMQDPYSLYAARSLPSFRHQSR